MKIAVLTDVHGNLPALQVALNAIQEEECDAIYHTGDAIGIGPYPAECLDLLLNSPRLHLLMGNHDAWFCDGLPQPQPPWMSDGELEHQHWVHSCLDPSLRSVVRQWPYRIDENIEDIQLTFVHYGLKESQNDFVSTIRDPDPHSLDDIFASYQSEIVFYGHEHSASDLHSQTRYINPGSLGCNTESIARFVILECSKSRYTLRKQCLPYDDAALFHAFENRKVPERNFIYKAFFGGRYP